MNRVLRYFHSFVVVLLLALVVCAPITQAQDVLTVEYEETGLTERFVHYDANGRFLGALGELNQHSDSLDEHFLKAHPVSGKILMVHVDKVPSLGGGPSNSSFLLKEFDGNSGKFLRTITIGGSQPVDFEIKKFVFHKSTGNILVLAPDTRIQIGNDDNGNPVYAKKVNEYDYGTGEFVRDFLDPLGAGFLRAYPQFHPQTGRMYIFNRNRQMLIFDSLSNAFRSVAFTNADLDFDSEFRFHPITGNLWIHHNTGNPFPGQMWEVQSDTGTILRKVDLPSSLNYKNKFEMHPVTGDIYVYAAVGQGFGSGKFPNEIVVFDPTSGIVKSEFGESRIHSWLLRQLIFLKPGVQSNLVVQPLMEREGTRFAWKQLSGTAKPEVITYRIFNRGNVPLDYSITQTSNWMDMEAPSGILKPGEKKLINFTFNSNQQNLGLGAHTNEVSFINSTSSETLSRPVTLYVGKDTFSDLQLDNTTLNLDCSAKECLLNSKNNFNIEATNQTAGEITFTTLASENWIAQGARLTRVVGSTDRSTDTLIVSENPWSKQTCTVTRSRTPLTS